MKYLLVLVVVVVVLWLLMARQRSRPKGGERAKPGRASGQPAAMLACAHCGVHLPLDDALTDAAGQVFCSEAHRLAGPR